MRFRPSEVLPLLAIAAGIIVVHALGINGPTAAFFALFAVLATGYEVGPRLGRDGRWTTLTWGSLSALATLMLLRGIWFYAGGALDRTADAWTSVLLLAIALVAVLFLDETHPSPDETMSERSPWGMIWELIVLLASVAGFAAIAYAAMHHAATDAIRTPWPLLPRWTLPLIGMLWALALGAAWRLRRSSVTFVQIACALGALTVITPLVYAIGYGFDGFLHVAGETVLAKTGVLTPKPPYYMGQYVFVTWIAQLFDLEIGFIDRWLVPIAAALLIPAAALRVSRHRAVMMLALVLIPFGAFVATTPHGFATVLAVVALILTIEMTPDTERFLPILFALWSTLTHPLVGLPILCAVIAATFWRSGWMKWALGFPAAVMAGIAVPLVFGLASQLGSSAGVNFEIGTLVDPSAWQSVIAGFIPWVPNRFALWPQAGQWIVMILPWITVAFAVMALFRRERETVIPWIIASVSTFSAALVLRLAGDFGFLIDYERGNYADRLFVVAGLLLLPVAMPEFGRRIAQAVHAPLVNRIAVIVAIGLLGAGASYAALPRHDAVVPSRGWSVGKSDIAAVKLIDEDAQNQPYTVLANQSVSAAAVKTFGFKRYNGDVFFYPIPTGGPLYDVFLRASYEDPSRETMRDAARLGGSNLVYFVVNDYWWSADKLSEEAASSTDREFVIDDGKVKIFKYELK